MTARGFAPLLLCAGLCATVQPAGLAQTAAQVPQQNAASPAQADSAATPADSVSKKKITRRDRRRAAELYLEGAKDFEKERFEEAQSAYESAAKLDPDNNAYPNAAEVAKSHRVTQLIQQAAKARIMGRLVESIDALRKAQDLDPHNVSVTQHLFELAQDAGSSDGGFYAETGRGLGPAPQLQPETGAKTFHLHADAWQVIKQVYRSYGIDATIDQSVPPRQVRFDMDDATFAQAAHALDLITDSFSVALDPRRALIAKDNAANRKQFERLEVETLYLPGLTPQEFQEIGTLARTVFDAKQIALSQSTNTLTLRATRSTEDAFNSTLRTLLDGRSQVLLHVRLIQLAHTRGRNTGITPPQAVSAFNVYSQEQSILNANQGLVQEIIASGLASPDDPLAILGILIASGQVSSSLFQNGIALFGGGLTLSGLSPGPATLNLALNSSDSRQLDDIQLRLGDEDDGTIRSGLRYPIETSSFSSLSGSGINIPGLTLPGTSSSLSSLLSSINAGAQNIPQVQYQDLGLTLKARPRVLRNGDVALNLDFKITALAGQQINGIPVLNNRAFSGVVQVKDGEAAVLTSELSEQESHGLSGVPGFSEIPGLNDVTNKSNEKDFATLLIVITPHVIRGLQSSGHTNMMRIERVAQ